MMKPLVKSLIPIGVIAAFVGLLVNIPSANAERISCTERRTGRICRIDEPNVNRYVTEYPDVPFEPGDRVTIIRAGGCVQTGGVGRTWKRYVNPSSDNDLYHGLIWIPGYSLERIENVIGRTFTIPQNINPQNLYLRLGYEDDDYGDNGYSGHDDGTANQCRGVGSAWVTLRIQPSP